MWIREKFTKTRMLFHKIFVYILIFSHLNWSTQSVASVILETREQDAFRKERAIVYKAPSSHVGSRKINLQQDGEKHFRVNFKFLPYIGPQEYYFGDKLVACSNINGTTFTFEGYDNYSFTLESWLSAERASFKTGGSLSFLERVSLHSLDVQGSEDVTFSKAVSLKEKAKISAKNILFQEPTSAEILDLTAKGNVTLQSQNKCHKLYARAGDLLEIGSKNKLTTFDVLDDVGIRAKKFINHSVFSSEVGRITVHAKEIEVAKSGAIKAENTLTLKSDTLKNEGSIEGKRRTKLTNQMFYNTGKVNIAENFLLENSDFIENKGEFTCGNDSVIKANLLSNRGTWRTQGKSSLVLSENLYNSGGFSASGETQLQTPALSNYGKMNFEHLSDIKGGSVKNSGDISINGLLIFTLTQDLVNDEKGTVFGNGQLKGSYQKLHNKGKWYIDGTFVSEGQELINGSKAQWKISKFWQHKSQELSLDGHVDTGSLAILDLERQGRFLGFIQSHALQVSSDCSIMCTPSSSFDITHHLNLNAKGLISFDSQILDRKGGEDKAKVLSADLQKYARTLRRGVFLTAGSHLQKGGRIVAEHGSVSLDSRGSFKHMGLTESGVDEGDQTRLSASDLCEISGIVKSNWLLDISSEKNLLLEKESHLSAQDATLRAKESINSYARIDVQNSLLARSLFVTNQGHIRGNDLHFKADRVFSNILGGVIEGQNTTVDALMSVNSLAYMTSRNLTINSALDVNAGGVRSAFNANINSLVILNAGLNLPRFDSLDDVFSKQNFQNAAFALIATFAPPSVSTLFNLGRSILNLPNLIRDVKKLSKQASELKMDEVGVSDVISLICQGKSLATSAIQTASSLASGQKFLTGGYKLYSEGKLGATFNESVQTWKDSVNEFSSKTYQAYQEGKLRDHLATFKEPALLATGTVIGSFGPHYNTDSLLNVNIGVNLGVNGYERNLMSLNNGLNGFANTYTLDTAYAQNNGILASSRLRVDAYQGFKNSGDLIGLTGVVNGGDLELGGYVGFSHQLGVNGTNISIDGTHDGKTLNYHARESLQIKKDAVTTSEKIVVQGKNVLHEGTIKTTTKNATVTAEQNLTTTTKSCITGAEAILKAGDTVIIGGEVKGTNKSHVFGAKGTTLNSSGLVSSDGERLVGIDYQIQRDNEQKPQVVTIHSQKTDIQGQIKDLSDANNESGHTLIGGHEVDIKGQIQSHLQIDVNALENLHIHKEASAIGQAVHAHGKNIINEGNVKATGGTASLISDNDLTTVTGSTIEGVEAIAKAGRNAVIAGEIKGKELVQTFGAQSTTVTSTGVVSGEKERLVGIGDQAHKDHEGKSQTTTIYSQKTDVQGQIKDTSVTSHEGSHTIVGGYDVDIKGQVQSHGIADVQAQKNLNIYQEGTIIGEQGAIAYGKSVTHSGSVQANQGIALVMGREETVLNETSVTTGQYVSVGKTSSITESSRSQKTEIREGAQLKGENVFMAGDQLYSAAKVNADHFSGESNKGEIVNLQHIQANSAHIALGRYKGGAQGAIDTANQMTLVDNAYVDASQEAFINNRVQTIQGKVRTFIFNQMDNSARINANGALGLFGKDGFRTTADIHAETGLATGSEQRKHELLNGAVLSTTHGLNYVEANNGAVRQSVILPDGTLKRAGLIGDDVDCNIKGDCYDTASQILARNKYSNSVKGNQHEHALECPNETVSINVDGSRDVLQGGEKATQTFARSEYGSSIIEEEITGKLHTEAGARHARTKGITIAWGGVNAKALQHTYIAEEWDYRSGFCKHRKSAGFRETTDFYRPEFHSAEGQYDIYSPEGKCELEAALFKVAKTSNIYGRNGVELTAAVARNHYQGSNSSCYGVSKTKYKGYEDTAQVAHVIGKEKINIINEKGEMVFQAPVIEADQGGGVYAPNGIRDQDLILESHHHEKNQGLFFDCIANRSASSTHPIVQRIANLAENKDGVTGVVSDVCGLTSSVFNSATHAAQIYNMNGNVTDFIASEVGMSRVALGYQNSSVDRHTKQNVQGLIRSGGDFVIQTDKAEADLSNMNLDMTALYLDTDKIKLAGTKQTIASKEKSTQVALSFDPLCPTVVTASASHQSSKINAKMYTPTQNNIDHLHIIRPDTKIELHNANLTIGQSSGESYQIKINDSQNEIHARDHHVGASLGIDVTTGMPVSGGMSVGKQDIHSYTTPQRSVANVVQGDNIPRIIEDHKKDRTTGTAFSLNYTQPISTETSSLSIPLSVSGQVGSTTFRVEPLVVNTAALKNDLATIAQASQSIADSYKKRDTRDDIKEQIRNEGESHASVKDQQTQFASQEESTPTVSDKENATSFILLDNNFKEEGRDAQLDLLYTLKDGGNVAVTAKNNKNSSVAQSLEDESSHGTQVPTHTALVQSGIDLYNKVNDEYAAASHHAQEVMEGKHSYIEAYEKETGQKFEDLNFFLQYSLLEADSNMMAGATSFKVAEYITPIALEGYSYYQGGLPYTAAKLAYNHFIAPSIYHGLANASYALSENLNKDFGLSEPLSNDIGLVFNHIGTMTADRLSARMINAVSTYHPAGALLFNEKGKPKKTNIDTQPSEVTLQTSRAARRAAMRSEDIPTSQQPKGQKNYSPAGRQLIYDVPVSGGGIKQKVVTQQTTDRVLDHGPHWEAGFGKKGSFNEFGEPTTDPLKLDGLKRIRVENKKSKVCYIDNKIKQ